MTLGMCGYLGRCLRLLHVAPLALGCGAKAFLRSANANNVRKTFQFRALVLRLGIVAHKIADCEFRIVDFIETTVDAIRHLRLLPVESRLSLEHVRNGISADQNLFFPKILE